MNTIINVQTPPQYTRVQIEWYNPSLQVNICTHLSIWPWWKLDTGSKFYGFPAKTLPVLTQQVTLLIYRENNLHFDVLLLYLHNI